ncbi:heat shock protein 27-like [Crassostrea virginica]
MSLVPVDFFDWGYWDRQRSLFPSFEEEFARSFEDFERNLDNMRENMFRLVPKEMQDDHALDISNPFVEDASGNKKLHLKFDCSDYKPEEIIVKTEDRNIVVHAKHDEGGKGHKVHREFTKTYLLPEGVDPNKVKSTLSNDGVLCVEAPAPKAVEAPKEKSIPIEYLKKK